MLFRYFKTPYGIGKKIPNYGEKAILSEGGGIIK